MNIHRNLGTNELILYKNKLKLTKIQKEILIGTLLGDSSMSLRNNKPHYSVKFEQGESHKNYLTHLFEKFEAYCGSSPSERYIDKAKTRKSFWFRTYSHDHFKYYYHLFYKLDRTSLKVTSKKFVPRFIKKLLTARVVAYWFMDDGTYNVTDNVKYFLFSTQGFEKTDVQRLCNALKDNFKIQANVHKDGNNWRIYIKKESSECFINLIRPFIHPDFFYKI